MSNNPTTTTTNDKLTALRKLMLENNLTAYYINTADPHQSEYIADHYKMRSWLTGFTGSAGYAVVTQEDALLWTDGRYFIQAEQQIAHSEFKMIKMATKGQPTLEQWLIDNLSDGDSLGLNGELISEDFYLKLKKQVQEKGIQLRADFSLVEKIWTERPSKPQGPLFIHELKYTGITAAQKIVKVRQKMSEDQVEAALYASLADIAWLFNIRGNDIQNTPVSMAFALITQEDTCFYIDQKKVKSEVRQFLMENGIMIKDYERVYQDVEKLNVSSLVLNKVNINHNLFAKIPSTIRILNKPDYPYMMKACLNEVELKNQRNSYLKDSVALTKFIYFIKQNVESNQSSPKCWCKFLCHNGYCYAAWFSNTSAEVLEKFWRAV